jgi:signal transduction histidine kinase
VRAYRGRVDGTRADVRQRARGGAWPGLAGAVAAVPVPYRWLAALLGSAWLMDALMVGWSAAHVLPWAAVTVCLAAFGLYRPGLAAFAASVSVLLSSLVVLRTGIPPVSIGGDGLLLSEIVAGAVLTVLVVWRGGVAELWLGLPSLVLAGAGAVLLRQPYLTSASLRSMAFGFVVLVGSLAVGVFLRRSGRSLTESRLRDLARRQWPLAGALSLLLFYDMLTLSSAQLPMLVAAVIAAGCAFVAPLAPVRAAVAAALAIAGFPLMLLLPHLVVGGPSQDTVVVTELAATMALIAFATRYARPEHAVGATAALVAATVVAFEARGPAWGRGDLGVGFGLPPATLVVLLALSVGTGLYFRSRDLDRDKLFGFTITSAKQAERLALARELHDVVAHHVTGIVIQAQAARLVAGRDPQVAVRALERIETSGAAALTAMRLLVGSMRGVPGSTVDEATSDLTADLRATAEAFDHGPHVDLRLDLPDAVPHEVGRSVLRLVQESLTNVARHAVGATRVVVEVDGGLGRQDGPDEVHVRVSDDGTGRRARAGGIGPTPTGGYGLIGMRERAELLGGTFTAGPTPTGWQVDARLPLHRSREGAR